MTRIDRRALFTSGAAAALLTATGVSLDAAPRKGGRLRFAVPRDDDSLDRITRSAVFDTLTELSPDGVLQGSLATAWHGSEDARTWRFDLRGDVLFHDGAPLIADDAAASLLTHGRSEGHGITGAVAKSSRQVEVTLDTGNPHFPFLLADPAIYVARAGDVGAELGTVAGTGMYRVRRADRGRHFLGEKAGPHFRDGQAGWAESVEVVVIPDAGVRAEALRDGYVDIAVLPRPAGLVGRGDFVFFPSSDDMALAAHRGVGIPNRTGTRGPLDDGRIAERWWLV